MPVRVAVGVVVAIVLLIIVIIISVVLFRRNMGHRWTKQKHPERDCDSSLVRLFPTFNVLVSYSQRTG